MDLTTNPPTHNIDCVDDCKAFDYGIMIAEDSGFWYAYYNHDTYGDGETTGCSSEVLASAPTLPLLRAQLTIKTVSCGCCANGQNSCICVMHMDIPHGFHPQKCAAHSFSGAIELTHITAWYCDLDLQNQNKIVNMMLDRYPDLATLLKPESPPDTIQVTLTRPFARTMIDLLISLENYLTVQKDMYVRTRKPTMHKYCEDAANGLSVLKSAIKGVLDAEN